MLESSRCQGSGPNLREGDRRASVRTVLYLGAMVAVRFNPVIRRFYERLLGAGKHQKVALTACVRKMIIMLNAMVRDSTPWRTATAL